MKLYVYDHCPYCIRARMIFGLKKLPVDLVFVHNDDADTPIRLIGKKAVPILETEDGKIMPESLDIVRYIDALVTPKLLIDDIRPEVTQWIEKIRSYSNNLLYPRFVKLDLPEYETESARNYFIEKKSEVAGNFDELYEKSAEYLAMLHQDLAELEGLLVSDEAFSGTLSYEDIVLFPILRNFTCIEGIEFPAKIARYIGNMAVLSRISLYYSKAC
ncbi:glutaredoxin 2 [Conservatibacter flavescens]|uniref:Glutaredoxin, GrxB family n=1 Tax=Conservatibacter flavescens TaxID=28161 RepID=A0A2M8S640_9PAST|nr:glutaredoxin 2 [Conservatibacter flavescens]PJG86588.1 glutaredoxin, GrxB family [Conservatibacter flavescens]